MSGPWWLYIVYDDEGQPLYVGQTANLSQRFYSHWRGSPWWKYAADWERVGPYSDKASALAAEDALIWDIGPIFNRPRPGDYSVHFGLDVVDCLDTPGARYVRAARQRFAVPA